MTITHILTPPRSGKTTRCKERAKTFLSEFPGRSVLYASYSSSVANRAAVEISQGNVIPIFTGGALTGRCFDLVILDDLLKDTEEASSKVILENTLRWLRLVVAMRLCREGSVFSISSEEQQMRLVVSAFGDLGVNVIKESLTTKDPELLQYRIGRDVYRRLYLSDPVF